MLCYMYSMLYLFITDNQNGMPDAVYYYNGTGIQYVLNCLFLLHAFRTPWQDLVNSD